MAYTITRADLASITDLELAFSTDRLLPREDDVPAEFWRRNVYTQIAESILYNLPVRDGELVFRPGFEGDQTIADLMRCLRAHLSSYTAKHQHKIAAVGFMLAQVCTITPAPATTGS